MSFFASTHMHGATPICMAMASAAHAAPPRPIARPAAVPADLELASAAGPILGLGPIDDHEQHAQEERRISFSELIELAKLHSLPEFFTVLPEICEELSFPMNEKLDMKELRWVIVMGMQRKLAVYIKRLQTHLFAPSPNVASSEPHLSPAASASRMAPPAASARPHGHAAAASDPPVANLEQTPVLKVEVAATEEERQESMEALEHLKSSSIPLLRLLVQQLEEQLPLALANAAEEPMNLDSQSQQLLKRMEALHRQLKNWIVIIETAHYPSRVPSLAFLKHISQQFELEGKRFCEYIILLHQQQQKQELRTRNRLVRELRMLQELHDDFVKEMQHLGLDHLQQRRHQAQQQQQQAQAQQQQQQQQMAQAQQAQMQAQMQYQQAAAAAAAMGGGGGGPMMMGNPGSMGYGMNAMMGGPTYMMQDPGTTAMIQQQQRAMQQAAHAQAQQRGMMGHNGTPLAPCSMAQQGMSPQQALLPIGFPSR